MTKGLIKDLKREIRKSLNRFISILCIVAIGTAFFVGLKSSAPDLSYTMDDFYDRYNIMDMEVFSTLGLTEDDIHVIREQNYVEQVQPAYFTDALTYINGSEFVFRLHSLPSGYKDEPEKFINQVKVVEGRLPVGPGEIVVEDSLNMNIGIEIGDKLTFESGTAKKLTDGVLHRTGFTVVGKIQTPYYLTTDRGPSQINGKAISLAAYIPEAAFDYGDIYTEALIKIKGAQGLNAFKKDYDKLINDASTQLSNIGVDRSKIRVDSLKEMSYSELDKAQAEYDKQLATFNSEIEAAETKLENARNEIEEGEKQLAVEKEKYKIEVKHAKEEIKDGEEQLRDAKKQLDEGKQAVEQGTIIYNNAVAEYEQAMAQSSKYIEMINNMEKKLAELDTNMQNIGKLIKELENDPNATEEMKKRYEELYNSYKELYDITNGQYQEIKSLNSNLNKLIDSIERTLNTSKKELDDAKKQLAVAQAEYNRGAGELRKAKNQLANAQNEAESGFATAQEKIDNGKTQYEQGTQELNQKRNEGRQKLDDAKLQLVEAKHQIELMENSEWFVLDRDMNYGFASYKNTVDRMSALSQIMPLFFILVAVLVCMTTMTRMVTEQRGIIGTYKALGYDDNTISMKYVMYVASASTIGSVIGAVLGYLLFPRAVYYAWSAMYILPKFMQRPRPLIILTSMLVSVVAMVITAYYTCHVELTSVPAQLMRPKAPKLGKPIFLERIHGIWSRLSFSQKVTARNIFRYKKRLFMTIIGIMGCTALLLAGLGLNDSISTVVENQFEKVFRYDISLDIKESIPERDRQFIDNKLHKMDEVDEFSYVGKASFTLSSENEQIMAAGYITEEPENFGDYIKLAERGNDKSIKLTDDGVVLTEKLADELNVKVGDTVDMKNPDGISKKVTVIGITENYVFHYVYMTQKCYEENYWVDSSQNTVFIKLKDDLGTKKAKAVYEELEDMHGVSSISSFADVAEDFETQISALKSIIILIIVCAALLAFVVLYNLTNVNISERIKEIATIKVLGFRSREVAMYVYRENFILTLMGGVLGLFLGVGLHRVIMKSIEQSNVMFGYHISPLSFVWALLLTCVFSILVMLYMYRKLTDIPMVESLKEVE